MRASPCQDDGLDGVAVKPHVLNGVEEVQEEGEESENEEGAYEEEDVVEAMGKECEKLEVEEEGARMRNILDPRMPSQN